MLTRVTLAALALAAADQTAACASPITFSFTGVLDQAVNGTKDVSGSFTVDSNPTQSGYGPTGGFRYWDENGSNVSLTVNIGGQTLNYSNTPTDPSVVMAVVTPETGWFALRTGDQLSVFGTLVKDGISTRFDLSMYVPMADASITNLATFAGLPLLSGSGLGYQSETTPVFSTAGALTSLTLVSTPEPGSIVVFAVIAIAAVIQARRKMPSGG